METPHELEPTPAAGDKAPAPFVFIGIAGAGIVALLVATILVRRASASRSGVGASALAGGDALAPAELQAAFDALPLDVRKVVQHFSDAWEYRFSTQADAMSQLRNELGVLRANAAQTGTVAGLGIGAVESVAPARGAAVSMPAPGDPGPATPPAPNGAGEGPAAMSTMRASVSVNQ